VGDGEGVDWGYEGEEGGGAERGVRCVLMMMTRLLKIVSERPKPFRVCLRHDNSVLELTVIQRSEAGLVSWLSPSMLCPLVRKPATSTLTPPQCRAACGP